jgi:flagella basal body P-ring formation protein FlgA
MRALYPVVLWCSLAAAGEVPAADPLEPHLRARRPDVSRWEFHRIGGSQPEGASTIADVGKIGPRTPVAFSDGRVRWYAVSGFSTVYVSRVPLESGARVNLEQVEQAQKDVIGIGCLPLALDPSLAWRTTRRLSRGDTLCAHSVEVAPEVAREQRVTLNARQGAVDVSRQMIAASDARLGERVRLRDRATGATLIAIVTGQGEARVSQEHR